MSSVPHTSTGFPPGGAEFVNIVAFLLVLAGVRLVIPAPLRALLPVLPVLAAAVGRSVSPRTERGP